MATKTQLFEAGTTGTALTDANKATVLTTGDVFGLITITGSPTGEISTVQHPCPTGTRSLHISGGSGTVYYPRWTGGSTSNVSGFIWIRWVTIPGAGGQILNLTTAAGTSLAALTVDSTAHIVTKNTAGTTLGTSAAAMSTGTDYRLDYQASSVAPTTGIIRWWLHAASDTGVGSAGTVITSGVFTAADLGTAQTISITRLTGKNDSTTTVDGYFEYMQSDTTSFPALPGSNAAPVANAGPVIYCDAGTATLHLSGSATDDTAVTSLAFTRVSGPTSPTITNNTAGLGTASATCTADVDVSVGHYVFRLTAGDGTLTHTDDVGVYVADATGTPAAPVAADANDWTASGGAASVLAGVIDGSTSTGMITPDNPAPAVQWIQLPPLPLGNIFVNLSGNRTASTAITRTVSLYEEDQTTLIDSQTQTPGTSYATLTYSLTDGTKLATIPARSDRRALWLKISSTV